MACDELKDRVALVTGGSRGIGRAIALDLAKAGAHVAVGYHTNRDAADAVRAQIASLGRQAVCVGGDVADPNQIDAIVAGTREGLGPIDILVSNGAQVEPLTLEQVNIDTWERTLREHVGAAFLLAQKVLPEMYQRRWGRVMLVSSIAALIGGFVGPHYATAKAALIGLMHFLAADAAKHGVTVNALAPSLIETDAVAALGQDKCRELLKGIPAGRFGTVEETAELVMMALGNGYFTGQTLVLDGGRYPR